MTTALGQIPADDDTSPVSRALSQQRGIRKHQERVMRRAPADSFSALQNSSHTLFHNILTTRGFRGAWRGPTEPPLYRQRNPDSRSSRAWPKSQVGKVQPGLEASLPTLEIRSGSTLPFYKRVDQRSKDDKIFRSEKEHQTSHFLV